MTTPIQKLHETIPALRQSLYGKDKSRYVPLQFLLTNKKQYMLEQLKNHEN